MPINTVSYPKMCSTTNVISFLHRNGSGVVELVGKTSHQRNTNKIPENGVETCDHLKTDKSSDLNYEEEIKKLKQIMKRKSMEKQKTLKRMQKDMDRRLETLAEENTRIKKLLAAEKNKNRLPVSHTQKTIQGPETNIIKHTDTDKTAYTLGTSHNEIETVNEILAKLSKDCDTNNSKVESESCDGTQNVGGKGLQLLEDLEDCEETFFTLDEENNERAEGIVNAEELTSTPISPTITRKNNKRRQTLFKLLEENSAFKQQLKIERTRNSMSIQCSMSFLEETTTDVSHKEDKSQLEMTDVNPAISDLQKPLTPDKIDITKTNAQNFDPEICSTMLANDTNPMDTIVQQTEEEEYQNDKGSMSETINRETSNERHR